MWAWNQKTGNASAKLVLLALAGMADARNCACPTIEQLTHETELNRKTVYAALDRLKSSGLIVDTGERRGLSIRVVVYRLKGMAEVAV